MSSIRTVLPALWLVSLIWRFSGPGTLQAQEPSPYEIFDVLILAEYEHPGVEVRVEGVVKPGQYPRYLELDVSPDTRIALLTKPGPQGKPVSEQIEAREEDGRTYLPVDVSEARFLLRYYFNPFDRESVKRTFTYVLNTNEVLPEFHIIIQKPVAAQNFKHSLAEVEEQVGEFDLTYYQQHIHGLQPGAGFSVAVEYDNPTQALTLTELQARMERKQAEGGAGQRAAGDGRPLSLMTVFLAVALLAICIFIAFRLWGGEKAAALGMAPWKARSAIQPGEDSAESPKERKFCNGCGVPRRPGARFCSSCGKEF